MNKVQLADLFVVACLATLTVAFTAELTHDLFTPDMQTAPVSSFHRGILPAPTPTIASTEVRHSNTQTHVGRGAGWLDAEISTYHPRYHGRRTASGARYDHWNGLTAAVSVSDLRTAPLGSLWEVRYRGRTVTVRITDTGSYRARSALWMDLSGRAWNDLTHAGPSRYRATARRIR